MSYFTTHRKCAFCGTMLFEQDRPLSEQAADGPGVVHYCDAECRTAHREAWPLARVAGELAKWRPAPPPAPRADLDPIALELVAGALAFVVRQMAYTMQRTAYSPVFAEANDFTCALFDADLEIVAQHQGLPGHLGSLRYAVPWAVKAVGPETLEPGDVLIHNDPYRGAPHLPEVTVIRPIFADERLVLYAATTAHQTDTGGKSPGSMPGDATEIYQEGLIIPPVKLFARGRECGDVFRLLLANVRTPRSSYGDISAMCGSLVTAERLFGELVGRHGLAPLLGYMDELKNYAERRLRREIASLPNGIYRGECMIDDDGVTIGAHRIAVSVAIRDDSVIVDFRGSAPQARGPVNAVFSVAHAAALNSILQTLGADVPINHGLHRPLRLIAPPGTVVNVDHPGALNSGNTESHNLLVEAVLDAIRDAVPDRVCAPSASTTCLMTGGAANPETREPYTLVTWEAAGWGAFRDADGVTAMGRYASMIVRNIPVEVHETQFPWRIKDWRLRVDSGGAGTFRGGLGCCREYELHAPEFVFGVNSNRGRFVPEGIAGGQPSLPTRWWIRRDGALHDPLGLDPSLVSGDKFNGFRIVDGDAVLVECPGGGGWGPPQARDPERVREDLRQGYISLDEAVAVYGLDRSDAEAIAARYHWEGNR